MRLEDIGFYTLSDERARLASHESALQRCELIITDECNFSCQYCRGLRPELRGEMTNAEGRRIIREWAKHGLRNIRFSGGEPTRSIFLNELVGFAKYYEVERIAVSTNGSASSEHYIALVEAGVNDFSVSLDSCCAATCSIMDGKAAKLDRILDNIALMASMVYTTAGIVLTDTNKQAAIETIRLAKSMGVSDVRVIPAAQYSSWLDVDAIDDIPILKYRLDNFRRGRRVRGLDESDNHWCPLVLDDMAVAGRWHFPCIVYLREQGEPIGEFTDIDSVRWERKLWYLHHDCFNDPICRNNCLDVCVDYNNRWGELHAV